MSASGTFLSLAVIALAIVGAHAVARLWAGRAAYLTALGTCTFALIIAAAHAVGVAAAVTRRPVLTPGALALATAALALAAWRVSRSLRRRVAVAERPPRAPETAAPAQSRRWRSPGFIVAVAAGAAYLANAAVVGVSAPPRGWDALSYHLPRAVAWLQHGNLGLYGFSPAYYPGNGEIAILLALFSGTDRLAPLVQLPFALLGSVAVYGLARELGARARSGVIAAAAFLLSPIVFFQSAIAKNDLIVTALCASGTYMLCRSLRGDRPGLSSRLDAALSGLAFGLAVGTKYTVLPLVLSAVGVVIVSNVWLGREGGKGRGTSPWRTALPVTALFVGALAVPSIFWFAQNWILAGNPFAPLAVGVGKWQLFPGHHVAEAFGEQQRNYVTHAAAWWWFPWSDRALIGSYSSSAGFGAAFAAFGVPALALLLWRSFGRAHARVRPASLVVAVMIVVWTAVWWFGGHHLPRFLLPVFALACAPLPLVFDAAGRATRKALIVLLVAAVAFSSAETMRIVYVARNFVSSWLPFPTKAEYYHMPGIIYELPAGTRILLLQVDGEEYHRTFRYPLAGNLPGNDVIMADDVGIHLEEAVGDPDAMHSALRREGVEYIFARTLSMMPKNTWFDGYPDRYAKIVDTIEPPYPWHRSGFVRQRADGRYEGVPAVTKMYRVIQMP